MQKDHSHHYTLSGHAEKAGKMTHSKDSDFRHPDTGHHTCKSTKCIQVLKVIHFSENALRKKSNKSLNHPTCHSVSAPCLKCTVFQPFKTSYQFAVVSFSSQPVKHLCICHHSIWLSWLYISSDLGVSCSVHAGLTHGLWFCGTLDWHYKIYIQVCQVQ